MESVLEDNKENHIENNKDSKEKKCPKTKGISDKKLLCIIIASLVVSSAFVLVLFIQRNAVVKRNISEYINGDMGNAVYYVSKDTNAADNKAQYLEGFFYDSEKEYTYYNYGMGHEITGFYNDYSIAVIDDNKVYEQPTKLQKAEESVLDNLLQGEYLYMSVMSAADYDKSDITEHGYCLFQAKLSSYYKTLADKNGLYIAATTPEGERVLYLLK